MPLISVGRRTAALAALLPFLWAAGCTFEVPMLSRPDALKEVVVRPSERLIELNKVAIVDVDGFIGTAGGFFSAVGTSVADVKEKLRLAEKDPAVKGVLLRVNSPGGEVSASDLIYQEIRAFRERSGKPVVAFLMGLATSGGYYVAIGADRIVASPTTLTGSVGVIMDFIDVELLFKTFGVRREAVKSGDYKDMGSPFRGMYPEERKVFEALNREMFERFMGLIRERRRPDESAMASVADGRVLSARQALDLGLIDGLGSLNSALEDLFGMAEIEHADVVAYRAFRHYNRNEYARFGGEQERPMALHDAARALLDLATPKMLYLWAPQ